jgi:thiamine kinase-like enzyme
MTDALLKSLRNRLDDLELQLQTLRAGGNSRVLLATGQFGERVVKHYLDDGRRRLQTEYLCCQFLAGQGLPVPQPELLGAEEQYVVYQRLPGKQLAPEQIDAKHIEQLLDFLARLHALCDRAEGFGAAAEACLTAAEPIAIVERRRQRLSQVDHPELQSFLTEQVDPLCTQLIENYRLHEGFTGEPLPRTEQTLSPSDFGFHNALSSADGTLAFVDFEYFGWDDPAKLIADFLWHPAMELPVELKKQFVRGCLQIYPAACRQRLLQSYSLHGMKWVLLVLNEFLTDDWQRRQFAGEERQRADRLSEQLEKAKSMLRRIEKEGERNPYVD